MAFMSKDSGGSGNFEPVEAGAHAARCVSVVDVGVQNTPWGGKEKVYIAFEIPSQRVQWTDKDGKEHEGPARIGMTLTNSINEKSNLGQHLTNWRGKDFTDEERQGFDLFSILGKPALVNIVHKHKDDKTYANIASIMRLPQGMTCPPAESDVVGYSPMDNDTAGNFDKLPEWLQKRVREGYQMAEGSSTIGSGAAVDNPSGPAAAPPQDDGFDDSIPF